jgi:hypothetical protein
MRRSITLLFFAFLFSGCYHATVTTGARPSATKIENHWASGWIAGLVPPSTVETMEQCPAGVAQVDTQLSFANQLVSFLTLSIYTPMDIVVTCAEDGGENLLEAKTQAEAEALLKSGKTFLIPLW